MSVQGQKLPRQSRNATSALPRQTDIYRAAWLVSFVLIPDIRNDARSVGAELFDVHFFRPPRFGVGAGRSEHRFDDEVETANEVLIRREARCPRSAAVYLPGEALGSFRRRLGAVVVGPRSDETNRVGLRTRFAENGNFALNGILEADSFSREFGAPALLNRLAAEGGLQVGSAAAKANPGAASMMSAVIIRMV